MMEWGIYSDQGFWGFLYSPGTEFMEIFLKDECFHDSNENSSRLQLFYRSEITMVTKQISFWVRALL